MSFEEFIEIESTLDVGENDLVPVSIQDDEVYTDLLLVDRFLISEKFLSDFFSLFYHQITQIRS